jgi:anti-anti-sigma factor
VPLHTWVPLIVRVTEEPRGVVLRLEGEAQVPAVDRMQLALLRLVARRVRFVVVDLSGLNLLSSLALGALVGFRRDLVRLGGRVRIAGVQPGVYESMKATRLHTLFEFCDTVAEALAAG